MEVPMLECFKRLSNRSKTDKKRSYDSDTDLIIQRMEEYEEKTKPVINYYKKQSKYTLVNGTGDKDAVNELLSDVIEKWFTKIR